MSDRLVADTAKLSAIGTNLIASVQPFMVQCGQIGLAPQGIRNTTPSLFTSLDAFAWTWDNEASLIVQDLSTLGDALVQLAAAYDEVDSSHFVQ